MPKNRTVREILKEIIPYTGYVTKKVVDQAVKEIEDYYKEVTKERDELREKLTKVCVGTGNIMMESKLNKPKLSISEIEKVVNKVYSNMGVDGVDDSDLAKAIHKEMEKYKPCEDCGEVVCQCFKQD